MKKPPTVEYIHVEPPPTIWGPMVLVAGLVIAAIVWIFAS